MDNTTVSNVAVSVLGVGLVLATLTLLSGVGFGPCHDTLAFTAPFTDAEVAVNATDDALAVTYVDGDVLTEESTLSVSAVVDDAQSEATNRYVVWNRSEGLPLEPGDGARLDHVPMDGEKMSPGDRVRIVWRGYERPLPEYCLTSRGNGTARTRLGATTVTS